MLSYIVRSDLYIYQADLEKGKVCLTEAKQFFMALLEDTDYEDLINQHLLNIEDRLKDFD
jgi:hypothetical protein